MNYILNAAVITGPGIYSYRLLTREQAAEWLRSREWESRIGYPATAEHIQSLCGKRPALSREQIVLQPGDEALVVRLKYRLNDPGQKKDFVPGPDDWEYGVVIRKE